MNTQAQKTAPATLEQRLLEALALLKRAAGYASAYPTIGGHKLNDEICTFRETVQAELETNAQAKEDQALDDALLQMRADQDRSAYFDSLDEEQSHG